MTELHQTAVLPDFPAPPEELLQEQYNRRAQDNIIRRWGKGSNRHKAGALADVVTLGKEGARRKWSIGQVTLNNWIETFEKETQLTIPRANVRISKAVEDSLIEAINVYFIKKDLLSGKSVAKTAHLFNRSVFDLHSLKSTWGENKNVLVKKPEPVKVTVKESRTYNIEQNRNTRNFTDAQRLEVAKFRFNNPHLTLVEVGAKFNVSDFAVSSWHKRFLKQLVDKQIHEPKVEGIEEVTTVPAPVAEPLRVIEAAPTTAEESLITRNATLEAENANLKAKIAELGKTIALLST